MIKKFLGNNFHSF